MFEVLLLLLIFSSNSYKYKKKSKTQKSNASKVIRGLCLPEAIVQCSVHCTPAAGSMNVTKLAANVLQIGGSVSSRLHCAILTFYLP